MADRYTKSVVKIIAAVICVLAVENVPLSEEAKAQNYGPAYVVVDQVST